jgi:hypothetical protein
MQYICKIILNSKNKIVYSCFDMKQMFCRVNIVMCIY